MFTSTRIQEHLKQLRIAKELTVAQAAEQCGISKSMLSMVENGTRVLGFDDTRALLRMYDYSVETMVQLLFQKKFYKELKEIPPTPLTLHKHEEVLFADNETRIIQCLWEDLQWHLRIDIAPKSDLRVAPIQPTSTAKCTILQGTVLCEATVQGKKTETVLKQGSICHIHPNYTYAFRNHREEPCTFFLMCEKSLL